MPTARELYAAGQLDAAIEQLGSELRNNPTDPQRRTFLFELLSFAGQYDRAEKQLDALARSGSQAEAGTLVYRAALQAERIREHMFATGDFPSGAAPAPVAGTLNGRAFSSIEDADPRIGARLEVMAGGRYLWIPFAYLAAIHMDAPGRLRDLRWAPARLSTGPAVRDMELGEVLLPLLTPAAWRATDAELRLGRATDWDELPDGDFAPVGQKMLRVDEELVPLVELRDLVITPGVSPPDDAVARRASSADIVLRASGPLPEQPS
jgi:type VI secretion system protein ImpE